MVDPRGSLNNNPLRNSPSRRSTTSLQSATDNWNGPVARPRSEADLLVSMNALNLNRAAGAHQLPTLPLPAIPTASHHVPSVSHNFPTMPPLVHYRHHSFQPLTLHPR